MTGAASGVPDATVIRVTTGRSVVFLSRPGLPSRSCRDRSMGRYSVLSCCAVRSSDACQSGRRVSPACRVVAAPVPCVLCCAAGRALQHLPVVVVGLVLTAEVHRLVALCSGGGFPELFVVVLAQAGYPFPFFPLSPFSLSSGGGEALLRRSGVVEAGGSCGVAERRAWSEEEVANHREGPLVGSFFVKSRDFLCPLPSGWIGSPRGFVDSLTAFPMLPSPVCACV
ncbi:hypothetical protein Taro_045130 [Colocasia esculenta]|uniref:Uncharacterized protein n=1 Tax=Colocasia esculenta TaxID=4460 RepID=A0A843X3R9_COLES|nr:hypothetical protein [Colocasia esculenta]